MRPARGSLDGCGLFGGGIRFAELTGADPKAILAGDIAYPCSGLSGGWDGDPASLCRKFGARQGWRGDLAWRGDRPVCSLNGPGGRQSTLPLALPVACAASFAELTGKPLFPGRSEEGYIRTSDTVLAFRWRDRDLRCFLVRRETVSCYAAFLAKGRYPAHCRPAIAPAQPLEVLFVEDVPPYQVLRSIPVGSSFRVRLVFEKEPDFNSMAVRIANRRTGREIESVAMRTDDPKIFHTPPIRLLPEVAP